MRNPFRRIHKISIVIMVIALFIALVAISLIWLNIKNDQLAWCQQRVDSTSTILHQTRQPESYATFYNQKYGFGIDYPKTWHSFAKDNSIMITNQLVDDATYNKMKNSGGDVLPDLFGYSIVFFDLTKPSEKYLYTEHKKFDQNNANEIQKYGLSSGDNIELYIEQANGYPTSYVKTLGDFLLPKADAYLQHDNYGIVVELWLVGSSKKQTKTLEILEKTLWTIKFDH